MYKLITITALVSTIMIGCGGGDTTTENDNNNNGNGNSQSQGFKYPSMFTNFEEFKMGSTLMPIDKSHEITKLYFSIGAEQRADTMVMSIVSQSPIYRRSHCEKGSASGSGVTYSEDDASFSGEITYITSSGAMLEPVELPEESCSYDRFVDGTITFNSSSPGNTNASLEGPFFTGFSGSGYFDDTTAYTGSFSSTTDGDNFTITVPNMEVFTVRSSASQPYEKGDYTEYEKVYYKNYNNVNTQTGEGDNKSISIDTSFEAQWHENSSDFILLYDSKSNRIGDVLTHNISYELKVVGDESKTIQATHVSHLDTNGHLIVTYTFTKDGKTKTESIEIR